MIHVVAERLTDLTGYLRDIALPPGLFQESRPDPRGLAPRNLLPPSRDFR